MNSVFVTFRNRFFALAAVSKKQNLFQAIPDIRQKIVRCRVRGHFRTKASQQNRKSQNKRYIQKETEES